MVRAQIRRRGGGDKIKCGSDDPCRAKTLVLTPVGTLPSHRVASYRRPCLTALFAPSFATDPLLFSAMSRIQPLMPLLRPLALPRRAPCEQLFRFSSAARLRADRTSRDSYSMPPVLTRNSRSAAQNPLESTIRPQRRRSCRRPRCRRSSHRCRQPNRARPEARPPLKATQVLVTKSLVTKGLKTSK